MAIGNTKNPDLRISFHARQHGQRRPVKISRQGEFFNRMPGYLSIKFALGNSVRTGRARSHLEKMYQLHHSLVNDVWTVLLHHPFQAFAKAFTCLCAACLDVPTSVCNMSQVERTRQVVDISRM